ncbi:MAG: 4-hydroxy-3-methylbut-2-enyl diphosphate reductase [Pseudomonadota bacterium]
MPFPHLTVMLAAPRGFCAGVERAIAIVERALASYGAPVYVRHEIVHNRYVVQRLEAKGAVFVEELSDVPDGAPVVFSAHGVPQAVVREAQARGLFYLDATCPLVSKVHREATRHHAAGRHVLLIGHAGHPEVIGTLGQLPAGAITLIESAAQAAAVSVPDPRHLAYTTQTTLSVEEAAGIVAVLQRRFPAMLGPKTEDICYATTNRQRAVKAIAGTCDLVIVLGAPNSSNARRLVEVASRAGAPAILLQRAAELDWACLEGVSRLGISAGASAPEELVQELLERLAQRFAIEIEEIPVTQETMHFKLPRVLVSA